LAIQVIVSDTSCLIDLRKGGLLATALALPFQFVVPLPLVAAELHDFTASDWADLRARGLRVIDLDPSQVQRAFALKRQFPGLSAYDCFSLALTQSTAHAMLLTGDQQLRRRATALGVEVHGILWLCDHIERTGGLALDDLADALDRLLADPLVFLPPGEVTIRIARMRARARGR
jgi:predicted nucleic acid-binding protein